MAWIAGKTYATHLSIRFHPILDGTHGQGEQQNSFESLVAHVGWQMWHMTNE